MITIKNTEFLISVAEAHKCPDYNASEIAVAGKSNVGKSSFINFLANHNGLAKTSSTAGKTRLLNYFSVNKGQFILVDLPGYGYARVAKSQKEGWGTLVEGYLSNSTRLKNVFLLVDIRHEPSNLDKQMVAYLFHYDIPFTIIATKADKLSKQQIVKAKKIIATALGMAVGNIIEVSSSKKTGKDEVLKRITQVLQD